MKRQSILFIILGILIGFVAFAKFYRPAHIPEYLQSLPAAQSTGDETDYVVKDTNRKIEHALDDDATTDRWSSAGSINNESFGQTYMDSRFLEIRYGWPPDKSLNVKVIRRSLLEGLFWKPS